MSKGITKNEAVQLNESNKKIYIAMRKRAEKEGLKGLKDHCFGEIYGLAISNKPDMAVRQTILQLFEIFYELAEDKSIPWEVRK